MRGPALRHTSSVSEPKGGPHLVKTRHFPIRARFSSSGGVVIHTDHEETRSCRVLGGKRCWQARPSARTVYVHTMVDTHHANNLGWFVDAVDNAIVAATGDVIPGQLPQQRLSHTLRLLQ